MAANFGSNQSVTLEKNKVIRNYCPFADFEKARGIKALKGKE
jgi:hypothetical protein